MSRAKKTVLSVSLTAFAASALIAWLWRDNYLAFLTAVFFLLLSALHVFLCLGAFNGTATRIMDLVYVVCGCVAAYLAVAAQSDRDLFILQNQIEADRSAAGLVQEPSKFKSSLMDAKNRYCNSTIKPGLYEAKYCAWLDAVAGLSIDTYQDADLRALIDGYRNNASSKAWLGDYGCRAIAENLNRPANSLGIGPNYDYETNMFFCSRNMFNDDVFAYLDAVLRSKRAQAALAVHQKEYEMALARRETSKGALEPTSTGYPRYVLWPYFLAAACALRLTKATADLTRWAG